MEVGLILKNLVIVGAILGVTWASQQPWMGSNNKNYVYNQAGQNLGTYLKDANSWLQNNVYSKVSGVVGGGIDKSTMAVNSTVANANTELQNQKKNFLQNASDATREFIAKEVLNVLHVTPTDLGASCPAN